MIPLQIPNPIAPDSLATLPSPKEEIEMLKSLPFDDMVNRLVNASVDFVLHLAIAIAVFYIGRFIIRKIYKIVRTVMVHRQIDRSLTTFTLSLVQMVLYFILIVTVIGILGLETSSFLAIFASAGVAIGMALSGTLQNFAGGVLILLLKPYRIGDYIEAQGFAGTVKEIQIFHTIIVTYDNKSIIIPNGGLSTGSINNWSKEDYRRVDWNISISYGDSVEAARNTILGLLLSDDRVVKTYVEDHREAHPADSGSAESEDVADNPDDSARQRRGFMARLFGRRRSTLSGHLDSLQEEHRAKAEAFSPKVMRAPGVYLNEMADSSINLVARAWTRTSDYWSVFYEMNELFYTELPKAGITFPFPQIDVHLPEPPRQPDNR